MTYCGSGAVPKGKSRGSAEYCLRKNQVRYYGVEKIDGKLLKEHSSADRIKTVEEERSRYNNFVFKHNKINKDLKAYTNDLERRQKELTKYEKILAKRDLEPSEKKIYARAVKDTKDLPKLIKKLTTQKATLRTQATNQKARVEKAEAIEARLEREQRRK